MTVVLGVFVTGVRYHKRAETLLDLQQTSLVALSVLNRELSEASPTAIAVFADPPGIVFASPRSDAGTFEFDESTGKLKWWKLVCFYQGGSALLRRDEALPGAPLLDAPTIPASKDTAYFDGIPGNTRVVGRDVEAFEATGIRPCNVRLVISRDEVGGQFSITGRTSILPRN